MYQKPLIMFQKICFVLCLWLGFSTLTWAQIDSTKIETGAPNPGLIEYIPQAPREISASDGIYDKFILIRWESSEHAFQYKVFRATSPNASSLQEVSNAWQKSTWLCDYSALPNVDYYYTVVASDGKSTSKMGIFDKGYLRKNDAIALDPTGLLAENEAYGAQRQIFLLIAGVGLPSGNFKPGETIEVNTSIQNIFEQATPLTELRYFFSTNGTLEWDDKLLKTKVLSNIPANARLQVKEQVTLPSNLLAGTYYLIVVSSVEGQVISSKTALSAIKIGN